MELTNFELVLQEKLKPLGTFAHLWDAYQHTRNGVYTNILPYIKTSEPFLTDHGPEHVNHVFRNIFKLLENSFDLLNPIELYLLCLCTLFHDVGNIKGRLGHEDNIGTIYDKYRGTNLDLRPEKSIVVQIVGSHSGKSLSGTNDTLMDLTPQPLYGTYVKTQELGAILKFADELAEGSVRTSEDIVEQGKIPEDSLIYHVYALNTNVVIDRPGERIGIDYHITVDSKRSTLYVTVDSQHQIKLKKYLEFSGKRLVKLDQERRYTKFYAKQLAPFKSISVAFNFWHNNKTLPCSLNYMIDDKVIPGSAETTDHFHDHKIDLTELCKTIATSMKDSI